MLRVLRKMCAAQKHKDLVSTGHGIEMFLSNVF